MRRIAYSPEVRVYIQPSLVDKEGKVVERIAGPIGSPEDFTNRVSGKLISY